MKKLLVLVMVIAIPSTALGAAVWFSVDEADVKTDYTPSDIIKINLYADFVVFGFYVGAIVADDGTAESIDPAAGFGLHPNFNLDPAHGTIVNAPLGERVLLIDYIGGTVAYGAPGIPIGEPLYSFEYHFPDVEPSEWYIIDDYTDMSAEPPMYTSVIDEFYIINVDDIEPVIFHVIPEPATLVLFGLGGLALLRKHKKNRF